MISLFFGLKFWTNVKNKYEKKYLIIFLKTSLDMQKIEKHVVTFPY
jgi:hypothetical protein